jgi:hypothetical protein
MTSRGGPPDRLWSDDVSPLTLRAVRERACKLDQISWFDETKVEPGGLRNDTITGLAITGESDEGRISLRVKSSARAGRGALTGSACAAITFKRGRTLSNSSFPHRTVRQVRTCLLHLFFN